MSGVATTICSADVKLFFNLFQTMFDKANAATYYKIEESEMFWGI